MQLTSILPALALFASNTVAIPTPISIQSHQSASKTCLQPSDVTEMIEAYQKMVVAFTPALGNRWIADTFRHTSSSVNNLSGRPLDGVTYATKSEFLKAATKETSLPLEIQSVGPIDCDSFALIWTAQFGKTNERVRGIVLFGAVQTEVGWQFSSFDVELNTLAYTRNIGGHYTLPENGHA